MPSNGIRHDHSYRRAAMMMAESAETERAYDRLLAMMKELRTAPDIVVLDEERAHEDLQRRATSFMVGPTAVSNP